MESWNGHKTEYPKGFLFEFIYIYINICVWRYKYNQVVDLS